jgi:hypothetical protein
MIAHPLLVVSLLLLPALALAQTAPGPANPPGTAAGRAADQALGTNSTGTNPAARPDGTPGNPPGNAAERTLDRVLGTNTSGANPATDRPAGTPGIIPAPAGLAVDQAGLRDSLRASRVIGSALYNETNERVGEVDELLLPVAGGPPIAVVSVGGFLGIGAKLVAVPFERLRSPTGGNGRWTLTGATKDSLGSLPTFSYETTAADARG